MQLLEPLLAAHCGEKTDPTHSAAKPPSESLAGADELIPRIDGIGIVGGRRLVSHFDRQNDADGVSPVGQHVRRPRISHLAQDACRVGF